MTILWIGLALAAGLGAGLWLGRRPRLVRRPLPLPSDGPPLLEWVLRANSAQAAWLLGPGTQEAAVAAQGLGDEVDRAVHARLEQQRSGDGQGIERLTGGTLVYASLDGRAAGLLLESASSTGERALAQRDLARLLDYDRWRPVLAEVSKQQEKTDETVDSVAIRLAHQLERMTGVEVCVAVPHITGVRVAGVSLRSDRRLLGTLLERGSVLDRVAVGRAEAMAGVPNPLGKTTPDRRRGADPAFVCPIPGERNPLGAIALWTSGGGEPAGPLLADFRRAIEAAGPRLQNAIERRDLAEAALRDPLTGLLNRLGLDEASGLIGTTAAALIYADIDHFKTLNDELGHPAGDSALVHVARLLLQAVRAQDVVARIGGEEFAIWLPGAPLARGREVAERIRQALSWSDWQWEGKRRPLSASFGVAAWPETAATRDGLPGQADAALYEAKRAGRDRVALAALSQSQSSE